MTLRRQMQGFLERDEQPQQTSFGQVANALDPYQEQIKYWEDKQAITGDNFGNPLDIFTHGAWAAADTLSFGVLDWLDVDQAVWGGEYGEDIVADNVWAKVGSALGTVGAFVVPGFGTGAIGGKAATLAARPFIAAKGAQTVASAAKKASQEAAERIGTIAATRTTKKGVSETAEFGNMFSNQLKQQMIGASTMAKSNRNIAKTDDFVKFAEKNIDDLVKPIRNLGGDPKQLEAAEAVARSYKKYFAGKMPDGTTNPNFVRPLQDFVDLIAIRGGKQAYAFGSMIHEAAMFTFIDGAHEIFRSMDEERSYDWTAPIWGGVTGTLFGALKFTNMPWGKPAGQTASGWADWKQGFKTTLQASSRVAKWEGPQLKMQAKWLGDDLVREGRGGNFVRYNVKRPDGSNKSIEFDLSNLDDSFNAMLHESGKDVLEKGAREQFENTVLRDVLVKKYKAIGKEARSWGINADIRSSAENWRKMILGTLFMNLHTVYDYTQGHPIDATDVGINVVLGAWLNRKGVGRKYDLTPRSFNHDINTLRHSMSRLGVNGSNLWRLPTYDNRQAPSVSPINNDAKLKKVFDKFENQGNTDPLWEAATEPIQNWTGQQSVGQSLELNPRLANKNSRYDGQKLKRDLFDSFYRDASQSTYNYVKNKDGIRLEHALEIQAELKKLGIKDLASYENYRDGVITSKIDTFSETFAKTAKEMHEIDQGFIGSGEKRQTFYLKNASESSIGKIAETITISENLKQMAYENKLGNILTGKLDGRTQITELQGDINNVLKVTRDVFKAENSGKKIYITDPIQLEGIKKVLDSNITILNDKLNVINPRFKFKWQHTYGAEEQVMSRLVQHKVNYISETFDPTVNPEKWSGLRDVLLNANLLTNSGEFGADRLIADPSRIKFVGESKLASSERWRIQSARDILNYAHKILQAKGQFSEDNLSGATGQVKLEIHLNQVAKLKQKMQELNISLDKNSMDVMSAEVSKRISRKVADNSNLTSADIDGLMSLAVSPFQGKEYAGLADAPDAKIVLPRRIKGSINGFRVSKIKVLEADFNVEAQKNVDKWNTLVDKWVENGKGYVVQKETWSLAEPKDLQAVLATVEKSNTALNISAKKQMMTFLDGIDPQDPTKNQIMSYLSSTRGQKDASTILKWMVDLGVIKRGIEKKDGTIDSEKYLFDAKIFDDAKTRSVFKRRIENYGVNTETIELMYTKGANNIKSSLEERFGARESKSILNEESFFDTYFSSGFNQKTYKVESFADFQTKLEQKTLTTPDSRKEYFKSKLFNTKGEFKGNKAVQEILNEINLPNNKTKENAFNDIISIVSTRLQSKQIPVLNYLNGNIISNSASQSTFKTQFFSSHENIVGHKTIMFDGMSYEWGYDGSYNPVNRPIDIFNRGKNLTSYEIGKIATVKERIESRLNEHLSNSPDFSVKGGVLIQVPAAGVVVDPLSYNRIKNKYIELKKKYKTALEDPKNNKALEKFDKMIREMESVDKTGETWTNNHTLAYRDLLFESMVYSSKGNKDLFMEYYTAEKGSSILQNLTKRFSLFNDNSSKKHSPEIDKILFENSKPTTEIERIENKTFRVQGKREIIEYYMNKKEDGQQVVDVALINDDFSTNKSTSLKNSFNAKYKDRGYDWESQHGKNRPDESSHDSQTLINPRYAKYLAYHYGAPGAKVYKPVISSSGEGHWLMYGKTAFFVDPSMNQFWKNNPNIDIVMTKSADKLKSYPSELAMNITTQELTNYSGAQSIKIKSSKIGISKEFADFIPSRQGPSIFQNYASITEAEALYKDLFSERLNKGTELTKDIMRSDLKQNYAMKNILGGQKDLDHIYQTGENSGYMKDMLAHVNIAPTASPEMYDRTLTHNVLKNKFLEPAIRPYSYIESAGKEYYYGGRSPVMQPMAQVKAAADKFSTNDLEATLYNRRTGEVVQYGEVSLANNLRSQPIEIPGNTGKKFNVDVVNNKTQEVRSAKKVLKELFIKDGGKEKDYDAFWEKLKNNPEPLGSLHGAIKGFGIDFDLLVSTLRFPRTRPNDYTYLRVKEFLASDYGNASVVNKYDIYNLFEGDYDIDTMEFYWMNPKSVRNHIKEQGNKGYVPPNPKDMLMDFADIELGAANGDVGNKAWEQVFSDQRTMKSLVGHVQSTTAQVNHMKNFFPSETNVYGYEQSILLRGRNGSKVVLDWDVNQWHQRLTLEGQTILDASGKTPQNIQGSIFEWRPDFLFPPLGQKKNGKFEGSYSREDFLSSNGKDISNTKIESYLDNVKSSSENPDVASKRIRIFRKFDKNGQEIELTSMDADIIMYQMSQYNKLNLAFTRDKIHTGSGEARTPDYNDYVNAHQSYQEFLSNPVTKIFSHLKGMPSKNQDGSLDYQNKKYKVSNDITATNFNEYFNLETRAKAKNKFTYEADASGKSKKIVRDLETMPAWEKYEWIKSKDNPIFDQNMLNSFALRQSGKTGSISERIVRKIANEDPLNRGYKSVLTGEEYQRFQFVERLVLGDKVADIDALVSVLPKTIKDIQNATDKVNKLDRIIGKVWGSNKSRKDKDNIINSLAKTRDDILKSPKFNKLSTDKWTNGRKKKGLPKIKQILVNENVDYIDATIAEITTKWGVDNFYPTNGRGMYKVIKDIKSELGKDYSREGYYGKIHNKYGEKTLQTADSRETRSKVGKSFENIEKDFETSMTAAVNNYGVSFLFHYMKPKVDMQPNEINIGIYEGKPITSAIMPEKMVRGKMVQIPYAEYNRSHKRVKKYILKGAQGLIENSNINPEAYKNLYRQMSQVEYFWKQYFNGNIKDIDVSGEQGIVAMLLDPVVKGVGTTSLHPKLNQYLSGYNNIKWGREISETNPFGMGRKYNSSLRFFRSLFEKAGKAKEFDDFTKGFSYINQMKAEGGYMDPMMHIAFMQKIKSSLGSDVIYESFPSQVDINSGKIKPTYDVSTQRNPLFALIGGGEMNGNGGITLTKGMSNYKKEGLKKFVTQIQDMGNVSGKYEFRQFKQEADTSVKKGSKDYENKIC